MSGAEPIPDSSMAESSAIPLTNAALFEDRQIQILVISIFGATVICGICMCCMVRSQRLQNRQKQRKFTLGIFKYLINMDADNLEIRRSPTGGFNVSYLQGLAEGKEAYKSTNLRSHSSDHYSVGSEGATSTGSFHSRSYTGRVVDTTYLDM